MPRRDERNAFADERWYHVEDELVDFAVIEERRDQPSPPIIQMSFPGIAWMRFANAGIGTVTSSTWGSVKFGG